jgi:hypothetical protein
VLLLWMLLRVLLAGMLLLLLWVRRRVSVRMRVWIIRRRRVWTATIVSHIWSRRRNYLLLLALHWDLRTPIGVSTTVDDLAIKNSPFLRPRSPRRAVVE